MTPKIEEAVRRLRHAAFIRGSFDHMDFTDECRRVHDAMVELCEAELLELIEEALGDEEDEGEVCGCRCTECKTVRIATPGSRCHPNPVVCAGRFVEIDWA